MMEDFFQAQDLYVYLLTYGLDVLDQRNYTELGDVVMIGGYPSDGKTALALMMAYHMAARYKVGFFSLETDKLRISIPDGALCGADRLRRIKRRTLTESDWAGLAAKSTDMSKRI